MILVQTPLRISFVGGGTDFEDFYRRYPGRVLSTSIDKHFYIGANQRFDGMIKLSYSETELVSHRDHVKHRLIKPALHKVGIENGIDINSLSDMPAHKTGLGLGSSSSFTVGLLHALYALQGKEISPAELAHQACDIEIGQAQAPIGKQDQYAAAFGGLNMISFNIDGSVSVEPVLVSEAIKEEFQNHLLMFFTGKERSADTILSEQKSNIKDKFEALKKMSDMVPVFAGALSKGDFAAMGQLLHQNWLLKKSLAGGISNQHLDDMYETALQNGVYGGKILGAGGGGFLLVMAPPKKHVTIKKALGQYQYIPMRFSNEGSKVVFQG